MKKLGKLEIKKEKIMDSDALVGVRGGTQCWTCQIMADSGTYFYETWCGPDLYTTQGECAVYHNLACYCFQY